MKQTDVAGFAPDAIERMSAYDWPGNIRELEQCVRNVLISGSYVPAQQQSAELNGQFPAELLPVFQGMTALSMTADEVLAFYCRYAYRRTASFERAAKLLQLDRRTVRARADQALPTDN